VSTGMLTDPLRSNRRRTIRLVPSPGMSRFVQQRFLGHSWRKRALFHRGRIEFKYGSVEFPLAEQPDQGGNVLLDDPDLQLRIPGTPFGKPRDHHGAEEAGESAQAHGSHQLFCAFHPRTGDAEGAFDFLAGLRHGHAGGGQDRAARGTHHQGVAGFVFQFVELLGHC
jgi:hypothetical protein